MTYKCSLENIKDHLRVVGKLMFMYEVQYSYEVQVCTYIVQISLVLKD